MLTLKNFVSCLLKEFPEFRDSNELKELEESNRDFPYMIISVFRYFFIRMTTEKKLKLVKQISAFLEDMANSPDQDIQTLLGLGFLENFNLQTKEGENAEKFLGPKTREDMKQVSDFWRVP